MMSHLTQVFHSHFPQSKLVYLLKTEFHIIITKKNNELKSLLNILNTVPQVRMIVISPCYCYIMLERKS